MEQTAVARTAHRVLATLVGLTCLVSVCPAAPAPGGPRFGSAAPAQEAASLARWRDRELRSRYLRDTDETQIWLALEPMDPATHASALTIIFGARFKGRRPDVPPGRIDIRMTPNPLLDPRKRRLPRLTFFLDPETDRSEQVDLSGTLATAGYLSNPTGPAQGLGRPPSGIPPGITTRGGALVSPESGDTSSSVETVLFTLPVGLEFLQLLNAETVKGTALGILDFSLSEAQLDALREFANRILSPAARP